MARVDDEWRQDGSQAALEVAGDGDEIGVRVLFWRQTLDALHLEGALELGEAALATFVQAREDREELGELLRRGLVALVVCRLVLEFREVREAADADHEPLVEVRLEDGAELDALEERHGFVKGLV